MHSYHHTQVLIVLGIKPRAETFLSPARPHYIIMFDVCGLCVVPLWRSEEKLSSLSIFTRSPWFSSSQQAWAASVLSAPTSCHSTSGLF